MHQSKQSDDKTNLDLFKTIPSKYFYVFFGNILSVIGILTIIVLCYFQFYPWYKSKFKKDKKIAELDQISIDSNDLIIEAEEKCDYINSYTKQYYKNQGKKAEILIINNTAYPKTRENFKIQQLTPNKKRFLKKSCKPRLSTVIEESFTEILSYNKSGDHDGSEASVSV
ncbi:MAG: hypothetical protein HRK26_01235 [Rickettsiaceae bacterium H1]|nr:hypothetical protein [Rickettsiaceae bacterium H1]